MPTGVALRFVVNALGQGITIPDWIVKGGDTRAGEITIIDSTTALPIEPGAAINTAYPDPFDIYAI